MFLARNQRYDGPLANTIAAGLGAVGFDKRWVRGRKVLLKPNLVEPAALRRRSSPIRAWLWPRPRCFAAGAPKWVGEAPGNVRDTEMALVESGMSEALGGEKLPFLDLNYDEFRQVPNAGGCNAKHFTFPPR